MSETLEAVAKKDAAETKKLAEQLLAQAKEQGIDLAGPGGFLNQLTKTVLETALEAEMTEHVGYAKHDRAGRERVIPATEPGRRAWSPRSVRSRSKSTRHELDVRADDRLQTPTPVARAR